jgi:hypothetical protein
MVASAKDVHGVDAALFDGFGEGSALFLYEFGCDAVSELPEVNMAVDDWGIPEFFEIQIHGVLVFFGFINYARWVWSRVEETMAHGTKCYLFVVKLYNIVIIYIGYYTICILISVLTDLFGRLIATAVGTVQGRTNLHLIIVDMGDLSCTILHN